MRRRNHGIIPKRGRQPGIWSKPKKIKSDEEDAEIGTNKMENNIKKEQPAENAQREFKVVRTTHSIRRRITKTV